MALGPVTSRERRWRNEGGPGAPSRPSRSLVIALALAAVTLITLDSATQESPIDPVRRAVGEVLAPAQDVAATLARPVEAVPEWFRTRDELSERVTELEADNAALRELAVTMDADRARLETFDALTSGAQELGSALVPARVIGVGPGQGFDHTVTIDAGSAAGVGPDMTVVANDGLVGRVVRVTTNSATVLLITDPASVVGGRLGTSMELGFVHGSGAIGSEGALDLRLVDTRHVPARDEVVVTWGSQSGPYEPGVPVGRVSEVYSSLRDTSQRAVVVPFVDFTSLDVVGVMVPSGTRSDRAVVEADGSLR